MSLILPGSGFGALPRLLERASLGAAAVLAMARSLRNRRHALQVADLPDHLLADMGLRRDDVHAALSSDWRTDPTYVLARVARERRCKT